ncbi:nicotinamide-nucleotide adenylyltransferase [Desulfatibacillum alkenivorans DSM 16219]|jgi:nicotinamide-nucleotide adenylyltransferase|uniref:Nicotinamide-nucleotide adenylyltransferase n=1 Tax=Desulfatibacillum alkenivorans DSM 16219 TaxID=1121393 RepID=A0A1M6X5L6_9BACT|nr:nicotinate-nucleotide adenylyltransferase [Desulfatibacillum alkenivorans]SHL01206.1 nicotinamide-nucleotide adenylyltransferase [Desulfatibacillum alkenivorans DSM 16219]
MYGLVHGRFQILHNDHMKYILAGAEQCDRLVIGITNPDPAMTREDGADPARSQRESNPLSYWDRFRMVDAALREAGLPHDNFSVVPFPINFPELWGNYAPLDAKFFLTIYDAWGERKLAMLRENGLNVHVLWKRPPEQKGITSTQIRQAIIAGQPWEHLVPPSVAEIIKEKSVMACLRSFAAAN